MMEAWLILGAWSLAAVVMSGLYIWQRRLGDPGIVDVAWSLLVAAATVLYAGLGPGLFERKLAVVAVVIVWAARLAGHVAWRLAQMPRDGRYVALQQEWGGSAERRMFYFYQMQALAAVLFSLPILIALRNPHPLGLFDGLGLLVGILAVVLESQADWQLTRFRQSADNRGSVCQEGWWRYSRHPNYFFEWTHWWAYVLFAVTWFPWGIATLLGPLLMWYFITRVTGIPPTEAQAIKSRGDAYRRYQQTTNAFFPWFPRLERGVSV